MPLGALMKKIVLKNLGASENLICAFLVEILSSSSTSRVFCLTRACSRVEMWPLHALGTAAGTQLWVQADEQAT